MDSILYWVARMLLALIQSLPLMIVARLGRSVGMLAYWLDARHRKVALSNLHLCFGREKSAAELRAVARENFRRIGENFACSARTAVMTHEELKPHFDLIGAEKIRSKTATGRPPNRVVAIGHFGNFELYVRFKDFVPEVTCATTYRGLPQPSLDKLLKSMRERSGCLFFERRSDSDALREAMNGKGLLLGLLCDQNAGRAGVRLPFLGQECSTSVAPAVFALRYRCPLYTSICYRVGLAHWRIEVGDLIATHDGEKPRTVEAIMNDVNRALEAGVRRDPANWFWVHDRWKETRRRKLKRARKAAVAAQSNQT